MSDFEIMERCKKYSVPYELFLKYKFNEGVEEALQFIFNNIDSATIELYDNKYDIIYTFKVVSKQYEKTEIKDIVKVLKKTGMFEFVKERGVYKTNCPFYPDADSYFMCSICEAINFPEKACYEIDIAKHNRTLKHRHAVKHIKN